MKDLVILSADKNAHFAIKGALERPKALGIRGIEFEFRVHPGRDGGARKTGPDLLRLEQLQFEQALLVLDFEGCGTEHEDPLALEAELDQRLNIDWGERAKSIVVVPEMDVWMWGSDNAIETTFAWPAEIGQGIRDWSHEEGFVFEENGKPARPKEALEAALQIVNVPRSSALYEEIASKISLRKCVDPAFTRLREQLLKWFPE